MALRPTKVPTLKIRAAEDATRPQAIHGAHLPELDRIGNSLAQMSALHEKKLDVEAIALGEQEGLTAGQMERLELRRDQSLRSRAFNSTALKTFSFQQEVKIAGDLATAYDEHQDNPVALEEAYERVRATGLDGVPRELIPVFNNQIDKAKITGLQASGRIQRTRFAASARAFAGEVLDSRMNDLERDAHLIEDLEQSQNTLAAGLAGIKDVLVDNGPKGSFAFEGVTYPADASRTGAFEPEIMAKFMAVSEERAIIGRAIGQFERADTLEEKLKIRHDLRPAWEKDELDITQAQVSKLENRFDADIRQMGVEKNSGLAALKKEVGEVREVLEAGFDVKSEIWDSLDARITAVGNIDLSDAMADAKAMAEFASSIRQDNPAVLQQKINEQREFLRSEGGEATVEQVQQLELAEKILKETSTALKRDPLSHAVKVSLIENEPIVFTGDQAMLSMQRRVAVADSVATHYGIAAKYLTDEEVTQFKDLLPTLDVESQLDFIATVRTGFGTEPSSQVFSRLMDDNRQFGHAANIMVEGYDGHRAIAKDILFGSQARLDPNNNIMPPVADLREVVDEIVGTSLGHMPGVRANMLDAARNIYTAQGLRAGLVKGDDLDKDLWENAVHQAIGRVKINGEEYGGFDDFNGNEVILPKTMTFDEFENRIEGLSDAQLFLTGRAHYGNGDVVPASVIKEGQFVQLGEGRYMVNISSNQEPKFLLGDGPGGVFVLDVNEIDPNFAGVFPFEAED